MAAKKGLIFGSIPCGDWGFLLGLTPDLVVCADGGLQCAQAAGFSPSAYIGDGDSGGGPQAGLPSVVLPTEKDETDLQAAYGFARDAGCTDLVLTACTGGRQDHQLAAFQLLERAAADGATARILDPWNEIRFVTPGRFLVEQRDYQYFSLLPADPWLRGVAIQNAKYPLAGRDVRRGDSLTVSNEWLTGPAEVAFDGGCGYLICSRSVGLPQAPQL